MPAAGMTREELAKRILDGRGGWTRHETEAIHEYVREFERATLERAAKANCHGCEKGWPLDGHFHIDPVRVKAGWGCSSLGIHALMEEA